MVIGAVRKRGVVSLAGSVAGASPEWGRRRSPRVRKPNMMLFRS